MADKILFVDGSNFYHSLKSTGIQPGNVNYQKFFEKIMYTKNPEIRFYTAILKQEEDPFEYAKQQRLADENTYQIAVLLSGDADLTPAAEYILNKYPTKKIINGRFAVSSSDELRNKCSSYFLITPEMFEDCLFYKIPTQK